MIQGSGEDSRTLGGDLVFRTAISLKKVRQADTSRACFKVSLSSYQCSFPDGWNGWES